MRYRPKVLAAGILLALPALTHSAIGGAAVYAASLVVTKNADTADGTCDADCSLREAIIAANAAGGDDIITVPAGTYTLTIAGTGEDAAATGDLDIGSNITINGAGAASTIIQAGTLGVGGPPNGIDRVFHVTDANFTVNISGVTVRNGNVPADNGGGIFNPTGTLTITNSAISGNSTPGGYGGGIFNNAGTLTIANSAVSGNSAPDGGSGGGVFNLQGTSTITNSTISGNSAASDRGGAIFNNSGDLTITNSTISGNSAADGSIYNGVGAVTLRNTIVSNSAAGGNCSRTITNGGNNIDDGTTCGWGSANGSKSGTDPLLGALTHSPAYFSLNADSPAIDAGSDAICAAAPVNNTSQNGIRRPQGSHCDIGSYEANASLTFKSGGTQDGNVLESSERSNAGGTINSTATSFVLGDNAKRKQYRAILSFNTSSLPNNAVISKVTLKIKKRGITGKGDPITTFRGFMVDVKKGLFGTPALQAGDFQAAASNIYGPFKPTPANNWYGFDLTSSKGYINKRATNGGLTQIRMRFRLDDNNNAVADNLVLWSGNAAATSRPRLIIEFYVP